MTNLESLNERITDVRTTNWGSPSRPIWLDVELSADEAWRIFLMHTGAAVLAPFDAELIHRDHGPDALEAWLRQVEEYGAGASLFIEMSRSAFLDGLGEQIGQATYLDTDGKSFTLEFDALRFGVIPHYTLTYSDAYDEDHPVAGFLSVAEVEAFVATLAADPEAVNGLLDSSADAYSEALALGWGEYVGGEMRRRRAVSKRNAEKARKDAETAELEASIGRHPAGKRRPVRLAEVLEEGMARPDQPYRVGEVVRAIQRGELGNVTMLPVGQTKSGEVIEFPARRIFGEGDGA